jgi:hypothetical protein
MHHPDDEALIQQIQPVLELDHQYTRHVEARNDDLVAQIHRCCRAAGKTARIQDPYLRQRPARPRRPTHRRLGRRQASNPDDENRIHQRGELLVQETLNKLLG